MVKKLTATDEIIQDLADQIITNKLRPHDKLANERELAEKYNVARGRIREALRGLSTVGLIEIRSGQGSFVRPHSERLNSSAVSWLFHPPQTTFSELFEAREMLDKSIYLKAFDCCSHLDLKELEKKIDAVNKTDSKDPQAYAEALDQFDIKIAQITRNPLLLTLMQAMLFLRRDTVARLLKIEGSVENSMRLRNAIFDAFASRDRERVQKAMDHFYIESRSPLESL